MNRRIGNECYKVRPVSVLLIYPDDGEELFIAVDDVTEVQTPLTSWERGWIGLKGRLRGDAFDGPKIVALVACDGFQAVRNDFYSQIFSGQKKIKIRCKKDDIKLRKVG